MTAQLLYNSNPISTTGYSLLECRTRFTTLYCGVMDIETKYKKKKQFCIFPWIGNTCCVGDYKRERKQEIASRKKETRDCKKRKGN